MGIGSFIRDLWAGPVSAAAVAPAPPAPAPPRAPQAPAALPDSKPEKAPTEPEGISGTANFTGRLVVEPIADLRDQAGFGRPGTYDWGFWEDLGAANSFVAAALDFVLAPVADARIDIEIPEESVIPDALLQEMAEYLEWALKSKLQLGSFNAQCARGFLQSGFSLFEPVFALEETGQWAGKFYCSQLAERLPQSLHDSPWIETDDHRTLKLVRQAGFAGTNYKSPELLAERILLAIWQRKGNNWAGRSAFRAVQYIAGKVMPTLLKLIGVTLQREGAGIPIAWCADKESPLTDEQRIELADVLTNLSAHESASLVMPTGWQMDWKFSGGANKGHVLEVWRELGIVVLQQLGAQQLALGTSNTGSRSVGEVHDARASAKVREVLRALMIVLNGDDGEPFTGLVPRMLAYNWGDLGRKSGLRVKLTMQQPQLPVQELATAAKTAKDAGLLTPTLNDENTIRERLGLAPIDEAERAKLKAEAAAQALAIGGAGAGEEGEKPGKPPFGKKPAEKEEKEEGKEPLQASAPRAWAPWRPLRASEAKVKWPELDKYFTDARLRFEATMRPLALAMLGGAGPALYRAMADGKVTPAEVAGLPLDSSRLKAAITKYVRSVANDGGRFLREELSADKPLTAASENDNADEVLAAQVEALHRRMMNRLRGVIEREAIDVLRTGGDADEVITRAISRQVDDGAFRADAGYVTTKAFNVGRDEAAQMLGGIAYVEYSAVLDSATCLACFAADGKTADFNSAEHDDLLPPNRDCSGGDNCRCILIMVPEGGGEE